MWSQAAIPFGSARSVKLDDFWIDRFEVTNRQFKEFVDQGGYSRRDYWREPFVEAGRSIPWEEAVVRFRDATGRPGPATWKSGTYPDGQADFPVGGVSWYEATAYAAFAGKSLPTMYHWYRAAALGRFADILTVSNFGGEGPAAVGSYDGLGPFGTYDMAGNVKEWCSNETDHRRFLLGGAWNEPRYMFADYDARGPFERAPGYGFRLAKYIRPLPAAVAAPVRIETLGRDVRKQTPVGDDIFAVYRRQYAYDRAPLNAVVEATEEAELWLKHTVAFDAAYGGERMRAFLFLPKNGSPPYQTVIFFPGADAFHLRSSRDMSIARADFIIRSGRALLYPVYKGTYDRPTSDEMGANAERELRIAWSRDLGRAIDYLETRSDIDPARLAFYGVSAGADAGVILTALEPRLKVSVLQGTGIGEGSVPEIDLLNYAPRVRIPTLLLNGRYDFETPFETAQRPLFDLLGAPAEHKRHAVFETGHALPIDDVAGEILPWLDRYLGPVVALIAPVDACEKRDSGVARPRLHDAFGAGWVAGDNQGLATPSQSAIDSFAALLAGNPVVLAPMDDVTDAPFRRLCRRLGAGVCVTEFARAEQLVHAATGVRRRTQLDESDRPTGIQIYGADARLLLKAAEVAAADAAGLRRHQLRLLGAAGDPARCRRWLVT